MGQITKSVIKEVVQNSLKEKLDKFKNINYTESTKKIAQKSYNGLNIFFSKFLFFLFFIFLVLFIFKYFSTYIMNLGAIPTFPGDSGGLIYIIISFLPFNLADIYLQWTTIIIFWTLFIIFLDYITGFVQLQKIEDINKQVTFILKIISIFLIIFLIIGVFLSSGMSVEEKVGQIKEENFGGFNYKMSEFKCMLTDPMGQNGCLSNLKKSQTKNAGVSESANFKLLFTKSSMTERERNLENWNDLKLKLNYEITTTSDITITGIKCYYKKVSENYLFYEEKLNKIIKADVKNRYISDIFCDMKDFNPGLENDAQVKIIPVLEYTIPTNIGVPIPIIDKEKYLEGHPEISEEDSNDIDYLKSNILKNKGELVSDSDIILDNRAIKVSYSDYKNTFPIIINDKNKKEKEQIYISLGIQKDFIGEFGKLTNIFIKPEDIIIPNKYFEYDETDNGKPVIKSSDGSSTNKGSIEFILTPKDITLDSDLITVSANIKILNIFNFGSTTKTSFDIFVKDVKKSNNEIEENSDIKIWSDEDHAAYSKLNLIENQKGSYNKIIETAIKNGSILEYSLPKDKTIELAIKILEKYIQDPTIFDNNGFLINDADKILLNLKSK